MKCEICGKLIKNNVGLGLHIKQHNITSREYYDMFLRKDENEGKCLECGNATTFVSFSIGYLRFCCPSCAQNNKNTQEKYRKTCNERYGCDNVFQSDEIKEKIQQTNLERLGVPYPTMSPKCVEKQKQTKKEKYGDENYNNREKCFNTCLEKYGYRYFLETDECKQLTRQRDWKPVYEKCEQTKRTKINDKINSGYVPIQDLMAEFGQSWYKNRVVPIEYVAGTGLVSISDVEKIKSYTLSENRHSSAEENMLYDIITRHYHGTVIRGDYSVLKTYELDFFLPEINIAFEYNGEYWHSDACKAKDYHYKKSMACMNKGVRLVHIYSLEDWNNVEEFVHNLFSGTEVPTNDFNKYSPAQLFQSIDNVVFSGPIKLYTNPYGVSVYGAGTFYKIDVE